MAKQLDLYTDDLDAIIFGLGQMLVSSTGVPTPSTDAIERRQAFKVYSR